MKRPQFSVANVLWMTLTIALAVAAVTQFSLRRQIQARLLEGEMRHKSELTKQRAIVDANRARLARVDGQYRSRIAEAFPQESQQVIFSPPVGVRLEPTLENLKFARLMGNVRVMRLTDLNLGEAEISELRKFPMLQTICLKGAQVDSKSLQVLLSLPKVVRLNLRDCDLTDTHLAAVANNWRLQSLELSGNPRLTDNGIAHLVTLAGLKELELHCTNLTDAAAEHLCKMKSLVRIRVDQTQVTEQFKSTIKQSLPKCKVVDWHLGALQLPRWYE